MARGIWHDDEVESEALPLLSETFPNGDYQHWKLCGSLPLHIEAVLSYILQDERDILQKASIFSWYLWAKGDYQLSKSKFD